MIIETYGTGERVRCAARLLRSLSPKHLVLLSVPSTRDGIHVGGTDIPLSDTLGSVTEGSLVVAYAPPEEYKAETLARGGTLLDLSTDEKFLVENAEITAIGTVRYILETEKRVPSDLSFGVIGYGRIGKALVRMLLFFGARVRVFTSKIDTALSLAKYGIDCVVIPDADTPLPHVADVDILINTAPKDMKHLFLGGKLPSGKRLLELASGNNFDGVTGVEKLPALPEKYFPESAGRALFCAVERCL